MAWENVDRVFWDHSYLAIENSCIIRRSIIRLIDCRAFSIRYVKAIEVKKRKRDVHEQIEKEDLC